MLPEITRAALKKTPLPADEAALYALFLQDEKAFSAALPQDNGLTILALYLHWLPRMKARYEALGIPEDIYQANLQDIAIWCEDFTAKTGLPGIKQWSWVGKSLRLELFRLGRLQFEPTVLTEEILHDGQTYPAGTPVLSVHIPAEEPLSAAAALDAFRQAEDFFPRYFGKTYPLFICHSWLMAPALKEILPPSSRILQFQAMFETVATRPHRQAEERVFGFLADDPSAYPEDTSLQRALKAYLLAGKPAMSAEALRLWSQ